MILLHGEYFSLHIFRYIWLTMLTNLHTGKALNAGLFIVVQ